MSTSVLNLLRNMFQSTHPQGVRLYAIKIGLPVMFVSIHAPAGGATDMAEVTLPVLLCFNPRTRRGCDRHRSFRA